MMSPLSTKLPKPEHNTLQFDLASPEELRRFVKTAPWLLITNKRANARLNRMSAGVALGLFSPCFVLEVSLLIPLD